MKHDYREIRLTGKKEMNRLERFVEEICDYYNINNEYFGNILLAATESADILMTINKDHGQKGVCVSFDRSSKGLIFKIRLIESEEETRQDEDILDREIRKFKLTKEIYIIKALADEITIAVNGKSIHLLFYISSMNYEKSLYRINKLKDYWASREVPIHDKNN
jgi:hypothetical protein